MNHKSKQELDWNGERYVPQLRGNIALEHLHRYAYASEYVNKKVVLDIASGEGYGSEMLSRKAMHVYGVDIDELSVKHAQQKYTAENLEYHLGSCTEIPLPDASVDVVVSFETIEHITDHEKMMQEIKRVLRSEGILIISSPEKHAYSEVPKYQNPYHLKELNQAEFGALLNKYFRHTAFLGQRVIHGSTLVETQKPSGVAKTYQFDQLPQLIDMEKGLPRPIYLVGVCSDIAIEVESGGLCELDINQSETSLAYRTIISEKEGVIAEKEAVINGKDQEISSLRENRDNQIGDLQRQMTEKDRVISGKDQEISTLNQVMATRDDRILVLQALISEKEKVIKELENKLLEKKGALAGLSSELSILGDDLNFKVSQAEELQGKLADRESQITQRDHDLHHLRAYLDLVESSWSWKLTNPLRVAHGKVKSAFQTLKRYRMAAWIIWTNRKTGIFDPHWYIESNPDVQSSGMNPWWHFAMYGVYEQRKPKHDFNSENYLLLNQAVKKSSIGAAENFLKFGFKEKNEINKKDNNVKNPIMLQVKKLMELTNFEKQKVNDKLIGKNTDNYIITFIIPDFCEGGGGHMNIFRMANYLERKGHKITFLIQNPHFNKSPEEAKATINKFFIPYNGDVLFLRENLPDIQGHALIATDRYTCYPAEAMSGFIKKFYFVQDYETSFYAMGSESLISENTYKMGFDCICNGEWLEKMLREKYNLSTCCWPQSHDRKYYYPGKIIENKIPRIAFYSRHVTKRRAVELGLIAFEILYSRGIVFHVDFFGWPMGDLDVGYNHTDHGILNAEKLGDLYRKSTIGVVFSATNHSIINKEMMACGLPVVDLDVESINAVFPDNVIKKTMPQPKKIADTLEELLNNENKRLILRENGIKYSNIFTWDKSGQIFEKAIRTKLSEL